MNLDQLLSDMAVPDLYRNNAFRVIELPVDCSEVDINRRKRKINISLEMGNPIESGPGRAFPLPEAEIEPEIVDKAARHLADPEKRFIDEFYWFWPLNLGEGKNDEALKALRDPDIEENERIEGAVEIWTDSLQRNTIDNVSVHNLAVLSHMNALDLELKARELWKSGNKLTAPEKRNLKIFWDKAFVRWQGLNSQEGYWQRLERRIKDFDHPTLNHDTITAIRSNLVRTILMINGRLAVTALQEKDEDTCERHRAMMEAVDPKITAGIFDELLKPKRGELTSFCNNAKDQAKNGPQNVGTILQNLLEQVSPILKLFKTLLPPDHTYRKVTTDEVADAVMVCANSANGYFDNSITTIDKYYQRGEDYAFLRLPLADVLQWRGVTRFNERGSFDSTVASTSIADLERALELNPNDPQINKNLQVMRGAHPVFGRTPPVEKEEEPAQSLESLLGLGTRSNQSTMYNPGTTAAKHFWAWAVDILLATGAAFLLRLFVPQSSIEALVVVFLFLYYVALHLIFHRTLGELITGTEVLIESDYGDPGFIRITWRALLNAALLLGATVSVWLWLLYLVPFMNSDRRGLVDLLSGTLLRDK